MTPQVYENIKKLKYNELLAAIQRIKNALYNEGIDIDRADFQYYLALLRELDNRQIES